MAVVTLDGTPFGVLSLPRRKASAVEAEGTACRARALGALADARSVNGDAEVARLGLGPDRLAQYVRWAREESFLLWWMASASVAIGGLMTTFLVLAVLEFATTGAWLRTLPVAAAEILVLGGIAYMFHDLFGRNTLGMGGGFARLAGTQASILSVADGRLYITEPEGPGTVREIRYDALGSVRHDDGRVALCDRAGRVLVDMGRAPRLDGLPGEAGVAAAVAEIRRRIPDLPAAA